MNNSTLGIYEHRKNMGKFLNEIIIQTHLYITVTFFA